MRFSSLRAIWYGSKRPFRHGITNDNTFGVSSTGNFECHAKRTRPVKGCRTASKKFRNPLDAKTRVAIEKKKVLKSKWKRKCGWKYVEIRCWSWHKKTQRRGSKRFQLCGGHVPSGEKVVVRASYRRAWWYNEWDAKYLSRFRALWQKITSGWMMPREWNKWRSHEPFCLNCEGLDITLWIRMRSPQPSPSFWGCRGKSYLQSLHTYRKEQFNTLQANGTIIWGQEAHRTVCDWQRWFRQTTALKGFHLGCESVSLRLSELVSNGR